MKPLKIKRIFRGIQRTLTLNLPVAKREEIVGNPAAAAMVSWYLLKHLGDTIGFLPDDDDDAAIAGFSYSDICNFEDRTEEVLEELIKKKILVDCGILYQDDHDPKIFSRDIRNSFMPIELLNPKRNTEQVETPNSYQAGA